MGKIAKSQIILIISFLAASSSFLMGCSPAVEPTSANYSCSKRASQLYIGPTEKAICNTTYSPSPSVTITGTALYEYRPYAAAGLGNITTNPIRAAEIIVTSNSGTTVQCGTTAMDGTFSLSLPVSSSAYTITVNSRAANSTVIASVLNCPEENKPYSLTTTVTPDSSKSVGTITAQADNDSTLEGGAFNIFDQIVNANEFLRSKVSSCSASQTGCTDFTVAPKVFAYWAKGFNPNYYYNSMSGLSFYLPGTSRLFILGGVADDILTSDTDHFDNSVIVHEYGHFLEDIYTETDSPGGSHSGNSLIDPRLAWGEGWGNFIQAAVLNSPRYRDTIGTPNVSPATTSSYVFNVNLEDYATGAANTACATPSATSGCDTSLFPSEGIFREFSVTRFLWDVTDSGAGSTDGDVVDDQFEEIWAGITKTAGFRNPAAEFRDTGLLHYIQTQILSTPSDWSTLRTTHKHPTDTTEYAYPISEDIGGCGKIYAIDPYETPGDNGSPSTSHKLRNNDFFHFYNPTARNVNLTLKVHTVDAGPGTEQEPDVDLYLYNSTARYGNSADLVGAAENYFDNNPTTDQTETIVKNNLRAGHYLINVKLYTGYISDNVSLGTCPGASPTCLDQGDKIPAGDNITYSLELNGVDLCP